MTDSSLGATSVKRLFSLDALRGLTIALMILVNNSGDESWAPLHHADWNGMTLTDLVFPTFLFVVGISIVFALESRLAKGATRGQLARHTAQRAAILFLIGVFLNGFPHFYLAHLRVYGVLQRIALCYLLVGLFYLFDRRVWTKIAALAVALVGYWALLACVPVPGAGVPGRNVAFLDKDMNLTAWVDRQVMPGHLYEERPAYNTRDPEGLLSTLPALGTTLLGLLTGLWLRTARANKSKLLGLVAGAATSLALGYFWSIWFPLNKKLWTSSYVLAAAGWSLAVFALAYWAIEVKGWGKQGWSRAITWPWLIFGSNAIAAFILSEWPFEIFLNLRWQDNGVPTNIFSWFRLHVCGVIPDPAWACFAYAICYLLACFLPVYWMYKKKIFLKI